MHGIIECYSQIQMSGGYCKLGYLDIAFLTLLPLELQVVLLLLLHYMRESVPHSDKIYFCRVQYGVLHSPFFR